MVPVLLLLVAPSNDPRQLPPPSYAAVDALAAGAVYRELRARHMKIMAKANSNGEMVKFPTEA